MKPYKRIINILVLCTSTAWLIYAFPKITHIGDIYWVTSIPAGVIALGGWGVAICFGLIKWFELR